MRLIDIDDVMISERNPDVFIVPETAYGWNECLEIFRNAPAVDAVPVVRGRWVRCNRGAGYKCSVCKARHSHADVLNGNHNYCYNCGADMRDDG